MLKIRRQENPPIAVIRAASGYELTYYEKWKLTSVEEHAQQNKIEAIKINNERVPIDSATKTVNIELGDLAFKSTVSPQDINNNELFFIKCTLDESLLQSN